MLDFEVLYEFYDGGFRSGRSKVYAIDTIRDRFLIVDDDGDFRWAGTEDCEIVKGE